jgi:hypothetical protein
MLSEQQSISPGAVQPLSVIAGMETGTGTETETPPSVSFADTLRRVHLNRVYSQACVCPGESLVGRLQQMGLVTARPAGAGGLSFHPLHCLPLVGSLAYYAGRHIVPPGFLGLSVHNGQPSFHPPGSYFFMNPLKHFQRIVAVRAPEILHCNIMIKQIQEHEIGVVSDQKLQIRLLLPGTHILDKNSVTFKGVINTNEKKHQRFDNLKFFFIDQGHVGLTQKGAEMQQYPPGPHISFDPVETLPTEVKILPQTLRLNPVTLNTAEQLRVTLRPVVYLMVTDPGISFQARRSDDGSLLTLQDLIEDQIDVTLGRIFMGVNLHDMGHRLQHQQAKSFVTPTPARARKHPASPVVASTATVVLAPAVSDAVPIHVSEKEDSGDDDEDETAAPVETYVETQLASALNIAITTTVHDSFVAQLQEKLNDFGITVRDVGFEEVGFDKIIQGQLDNYAQKQIAIRTEALTAQMELELAKQRAENDAIISKCTAAASAAVRHIEVEAARHHQLIQARTAQETRNMETSAEARHVLDVGRAKAQVSDLIGNSAGGQELAVLEQQASIARALGESGSAVYTQVGLPVLGFRAQLPSRGEPTIQEAR